MPTEHSIRDLAQRAVDIETAELAGEVGASGLHAWAFVLRSLDDVQFNTLAAMDDTELSDFLMGDHSGHPLWERYQDLFNFHEEWSYGEICEELAKTPLGADFTGSNVYEWILARMPITLEDYSYLSRLLPQYRLAALAGNDHHYAAIKTMIPGWDVADFHRRFNAAHFVWSVHVSQHGDSWVYHP